MASTADRARHLRRSSAIAVFLVGVAAIGVGAWALFGRDHVSRAVTGGVVVQDRPLPELTGTTLDGRPFDTKDLRGHVAVINVWATWCGPCAVEAPGLVRIAHDYAGRGVRLVGVDYRDDRIQARGWQDHRFALPYPSLYDPSGRTGDELGFPFLPDTFIVDASGTIRWMVVGKTDEAELRGLLDRVLAAPSASPSA